jgi:hypothetical protein
MPITEWFELILNTGFFLNFGIQTGEKDGCSDGTVAQSVNQNT